jgi:DNA mismatch endonuclease, patch repair protein
MVDIVSPEKRSNMMAGIQGKNTKPEMIIRKALHAFGFRYRLHDKKLPGNPDIVLSQYKAVIMVNGCFWHGHDCHLFKWPSTRKDFWCKKITRNKERDQENISDLEKDGWKILTIWECALKGRAKQPFDEMIDIVSTWIISGQGNREIRGIE